MDWPKSVGKGVEDRVADEPSRLNRAQFERELREYIGSSLSSQLREADFQVLFEISDEYTRRLTVVSRLKNKNSLAKDCNARTKLMSMTKERLIDLQNNLRAEFLDVAHPTAALLAQSISQKVSQLRSVLEKEFDAIELHQRLSKSMLRTASLKNMRNSYIGSVASYLEDILRVAPKKQTEVNIEKVIAGVMSAAMVFTKKEKEKPEGLEESVHMARWRAKEYFKKHFYDTREYPVFQSKARTKTTV
jgi:hypothetical protein